ncbi:putative guanylyl/methyl transferase [Chum salmon reovirus CS]|uniref:Outer capsid protein VP1 n=1 Tax=Aquareovirus A (isolate Chum salmon/Japan/CSRV/1981) TaxID=928295 RepID=VP1_AQRVA|nr:putative guanylyl/methyl transferase [Chum salmon reovirus CS]Q8VA43.1 RecName: Full=Outer capsid protein VP1; Includes: RecName: Full=mRNA guanylyltransferase; Includes: RecName: Full=mRNA (guanine-N(7))-methyltransferase [Aquareovirus A Chum salmon/Japan/CSRV/1981]AAL31496.1 putative guanylyl/methyl transferase [Chum salmon reovirus CS]
MATVYGIQLTNRLNTATVRRPLRLRRYDSCITTFTTPNGISQLYRALDFQPTSFQASILQTFPPLNAWSPSPQFVPDDLSLSQWKEWITERMRALATVLQRAHPLVANAGREVNPITIGLITSSFLNQRPIDGYLPFLFLARNARDPIAPLVTVDITFSDDTYVSRHVLYTPAGLKYLTLSSYDPTKPSSICTFGKHIPLYATAAFYPDETARLTILHRYNGGPPLIEHFDQPTYGPHVLIPALGSPEGYDTHLNICRLLLAEGLLDSFRLNASAGPSTAVARIDQTYHVVMNGSPDDHTQLATRLSNLSLLAVQGCQMTVQVADHPTMSDVGGFLVRLQGPGDPQRLIAYRTDQILIWQASPFPFGNNARYVRRPGRVPFTIGTTTYVPDTKTPLPFLPQYRQATVNKNNAQDSYELNVLPSLPIYSPFALTGGAFFQARDITGDPANVWPVNTLPGLPRDYFSIQSRQRRELLSRLRSHSDRSYVKDVHNISFASTVLNPVNNQIVLSEGFSMAYLGAASTHGTTDEPLIIEALKSGTVPGVPIPSKISQFGYDVANGSIMDATLAPPTGTFTFVYSDVDQVEDAGLSIVATNRAAVAVTNIALSMTTAGGLTVVKVNFPTPAFWTQLFRNHATDARALYILKPLIVNSVEVFLLFVSRATAGNLVSSPALRQFLVQLFDRSTSLSEVMAHVPLLGDVDTGVTTLGFNACRLYSPDLPTVNITPEIQTLAYQLATIVPSTSFIAREDYDGATAVTFYGKRTFLSRNRLDRLVDVPVPATNAINHQTRFTGSPVYQLFPTNPAPVTQLLWLARTTGLYTASWPRLLLSRWLICGTGPECRILSLMPPATSVTMIDSRPPAESLAAFNPAMNQYIVGNFLDPAQWVANPHDSLTAIFSLGAAFAGAGQDLVVGLTAFLRLIQPSNVQHLWLQLNTTLTSTASLPGLIEIDTRTGQYIFNGGQRTEPYAAPDAILAAIRLVYPAATTSWLTASSTMDWTEYVIGLGSSMSLDDVSTMISYSGLTPILHIDLTQRPMDVPVPLVVGVQAVIHVAAPVQQTTVIGSMAGVQVFTADGVNAPSTIGPLAVVWDPVLSRWDLTITPNQPGVLDVVVDHNGVLLNRGSTTIALPPATIVITFPQAANRDFTNAGNDAAVVCDAFYRLGVFVSVNGAFQPVNPERAAIVTAANARVLHYVYDLSDNHVLMYVCDITDNNIGRNVALPLADIFQTLFPNNTPLLASPPYPSASGRLMLNGQLFVDLDPLPPVLPPGVQIQALSTAIEPARQTAEVPGGAYTYVVV